MERLSDEELQEALTVDDRIRALNASAYVPRDALAIARRMQLAATEIQQHRAMVKRLKEWADDLESGRVMASDDGRAFALRLRNRMKGA